MLEQVKQGVRGVNKLDEACKTHDIAYSQFNDSKRRNVADKELASKAWDRLKASDSSLKERAAALGVLAAMKGNIML